MSSSSSSSSSSRISRSYVITPLPDNPYRSTPLPTCTEASTCVYSIRNITTHTHVTSSLRNTSALER